MKKIKINNVYGNYRTPVKKMRRNLLKTRSRDAKTCLICWRAKWSTVSKAEKTPNKRGSVTFVREEYRITIYF